MTLVQLGWRLKYRLRTLLSALKALGQRLLATLLRTGSAAWRGLRAVWNAAGYYVSLALLLVLLGVAAYAYRMRPRTVPPNAAALPAPDPGEPVWSDLASETLAPDPTPEPFALIAPVPGEELRAFDQSSLTWSETLRQWQTHPGVDLAAELGEVVVAAEAGEIVDAYKDPLLGNVIEIRHENGWMTRYASLHTLALVQPGQRVEKGEIISAAGATADAEAELGTHVHFELLIDESPAAPQFARPSE